MANALFEDDVDLHLIAAAARAGWRFKSGRGWVSIRRPGGGGSMYHEQGLTRIDREMLGWQGVPGFPRPAKKAVRV